MPKLSGWINYFPNAGRLDIAAVGRFLPPHSDLKIVENFLANKLLYPTTVSTNEKELMLDLAILRELIFSNKDLFYKPTRNKIFIPGIFLEVSVDLSSLILILIDCLDPAEVTTVYVQDPIEKSLATFIRPKILFKNGKINLKYKDKNFDIKIGSLVTLPAPYTKIDLQFSSNEATLAQKNATELEITGGPLGIVIDARVHLK